MWLEFYNQKLNNNNNNKNTQQLKKYMCVSCLKVDTMDASQRFSSVQFNPLTE